MRAVMMVVDPCSLVVQVVFFKLCLWRFMTPPEIPDALTDKGRIE